MGRATRRVKDVDEPPVLVVAPNYQNLRPHWQLAFLDRERLRQIKTLTVHAGGIVSPDEIKLHNGTVDDDSPSIPGLRDRANEMCLVPVVVKNHGFARFELVVLDHFDVNILIGINRSSGL